MSTSSVFGRYANWYDLFYADKDYRAEAEYVGRQLREQGVTGPRLLEIGCGTGAHAHWLVAGGWQVCGIDRSEDMLKQARTRLAENPSMAEFHIGDARDVDLGQQFDAVISLFHVMSYQAEPGELEAAMRSARRHLQQGGLFFFDFWHGPAVLAEKPETRVRTVENAHYQVVRKASPTLDESRQIVDVRYDFSILDKGNGQHSTLDELHRMRYLFPAEIARVAAACGFELRAMREWMSDCPATEKSWNACAILRVDDGPH